ncbi:hypothetical protein AVEN_248747-1 [Araneus ventricosus]|uniref:Uncharacterized protein n=1 Tax=Araneus ventricosus TaxID=182803 RepID=A0A4Y2F8K5_ARAVE|nr:hypothetical protein AVEN_248747-1 [Araneus ventricosus]
MTRTTPELLPPLQASAPHQRENVWFLTYDLACNRPNTRRIFGGIDFELGTLRLQGRHLTTRSPQPKIINKLSMLRPQFLIACHLSCDIDPLHVYFLWISLV